VNLDISYDSQTLSNAPAAFFTAVNYVVQLFDTTFTNDATVNIEVGYGDLPSDRSLVAPLGESQQNNVVSESYSQVRQALIGEGAAGSSTLPAAAPISGSLVMGSAEEKALGLIGSNGALDGWVGIASNATLQQQTGDSWSFSPTATPASNQFYIVGVLEHEITEVMGRDSYLDTAREYGILDLYRYSAPGQRQTGTGDPSYFSVDSGLTNLDSFSNFRVSSGDLGDWAPGPGPSGVYKAAGDDAFLDDSPPGEINGLSSADLTVMNALGWDGTAPGPGSRYAFYTPTEPVNVVTTANGTNLPPAVAGEFNLELVTSPSGSAYTAPSTYQGLALLPGGTGLALQLLTGSLVVVDTGSGDTITLGAGAQTVIGAKGDTITGGSVSELVNGLAGSQLIDGGSGSSILWGAAADTIVGSAAASGSSTIIGGAGDTITGGAGSDLVNALVSGELVNGGAGSTTIWGGVGDTILGGAGSGLVDGTAGDEKIAGSGGSGAYTILGGAGDTITGGAGPTTIVGARGDTVSGGPGSLLVNGLAGGQQIGGGTGNMTVWGGSGDNIVGGSGVNSLFGQAGNTIIGGAGGGLIDGSLGSQLITGGFGTAAYIILGGAGDTIASGSGADLINGLAGSEQITGSSGAATVWGGKGDTITPGTGTVFIAGQAGDTVAGGSAASILVNAVLGTQSVAGGSGSTTVWAGSADTITGGSGTQSVVIAHGNFPGAVLVGDSGVAGSDAVTGFSQSAGDRILFPNETTTAINNVVAAAQSSGGNTLITLPDGGTMTLIGIAKIDSTFFA
jgi:Ca2+-binding RTX toxin-like protein